MIADDAAITAPANGGVIGLGPYNEDGSTNFIDMLKASTLIDKKLMSISFVEAQTSWNDLSITTDKAETKIAFGASIASAYSEDLSAF